MSDASEGGRIERMTPTSSFMSQSVIEEDVGNIMKLMERYTLDLKITQNRFSFYQTMVVSVVLMIGIFYATLIYLYYRLNLSQSSSSTPEQIISGTFGGAAVGGIVVFGIFFCYARARTALLESIRVRSILDKLLRRASQLQDRGDIPFSQKVLLDVVVTDAFSLIQRRAAYLPFLVILERRNHKLPEIY